MTAPAADTRMLKSLHYLLRSEKTLLLLHAGLPRKTTTRVTRRYLNFVSLESRACCSGLRPPNSFYGKRANEERAPGSGGGRDPWSNVERAKELCVSTPANFFDIHKRTLAPVRRQIEKICDKCLSFVRGLPHHDSCNEAEELEFREEKIGGFR